MDFDAISWEIMPKRGISTVFSGFLYHLFYPCSSWASLWIRLLEISATHARSTSLELVQFGDQQGEAICVRFVDIEEIGIGDHRRLSPPDPAACDQPLIGDCAGSAAC